MANKCCTIVEKLKFPVNVTALHTTMLLRNNVTMLLRTHERFLHSTPALFTVKAGRVKITPNKSKPITYEQSLSPPHIGHRKSWNSWNTSTLAGGLRPSQITIEDMFIRKFIYGTFPDCLLSQVIIKRQYNIIRIAALIRIKMAPHGMAFLMGYTEAMLGYWLHCNVKLEFQILSDYRKVIFQYI